ncbi:MAG: hypothetical protein ACXVAX_12735, partial [Pseudobdellovibrio sp.]
LAYFDTVGGKVTDVGPDVSSDRESLSNRFLYNEAALARVTYTDTFFKEVRLDSTLQYKFSPKEKFREIRFRNFVSFKGPWSVWADMILIDTDSSVATGYESYKNLDQLWLGVSYDL